MAFVGNDSDDSGNNEGAFNFVLVGNETDDAGNNEGLINTAIFPDAGEGKCEGPACVNFFGTQFFGGTAAKAVQGVVPSPGANCLPVSG